MKKKIVLALSLLCVLVVLLFALASCGDHEHNFGATWHQDGNTHWHVCLVEGCEEVSEKASHSFKEVRETDATCEKAGIKKEECKICGQERETVLEALGHKKTEKVIAPSCAGDGYTEITCSRKGCKFSEKKDIIPGGHQLVETVIEPTCTEGGKTVVVCGVEGCGFTEDRDITPPLGHAEIENVVPATCQNTGYTQVTCERCDFTEQRNPTPLGYHNYVQGTVLPTCTEGGYTAQICSVCDDTKDIQNVTAPLGHDSINGTPVAPTCEAQGYTPVTCSRCDYTDKVDIIDALGHDEVKGEAVAPNCTLDGYTPVTCTRCDYVGQVDVVPALGHKYNTGENAVEGTDYRILLEPTCVDEGEKWYICANCYQMPYDEGVNPEPIPAKGHEEVLHDTIPPTCILAGYEIYICSKCDWESNKPKGEPTGHTYFMENTAEAGTHFIVTLEPTCTEKGERTYYCITAGCGELATDEKGKSELPALDHNFVKTLDPWCGNDSNIEFECDRVCRGVECNEKKTEKAEEVRHTYNFDVKIKEETCVDYAEYECLICKNPFPAYKGDAYGQPTGKHKYENEVEKIPSTCTTQGYTVYSCIAGECGTTEKREYLPIIPHTLGEVSLAGVVTCSECNRSYVDVTAEKMSGSDSICICGKDPCECGGTTSDWEGYYKPREPMKITANEELIVTQIEWSEGNQDLAIGNGLIVLDSEEEATFTVVIYTADGTEALYTFNVTGTSKMIDLYQYATVGKVAITSTADATVSFYKAI